MKNTRAASAAAILALFGGLPALAAEQGPAPLAAATVPALTPPQTSPVTDAMIKAPPPGDWLMWRRTQDSWGYSPLTQITPANVGKLRLVWSRGLSQTGKQEGTPLVHEGVMYMPLPLDGIQAMDAKTGDVLWEYRRAIPPDLTKFIPHPDTNRNIAIYENLIIDTSADDYVFALDKMTGKLVWETRIADFHEHAAQQTAGPIIADGKIISGRGCEPEGGADACVMTAHDARTGKELWRTRTIPKKGEPGYESWGNVPEDKRWHVGTWMVPSYDPVLKLVYFGTSVTSPAPKFALDGNDKTYLYHNSTLALDIETGKIVWHYQHVVDHWDLDHPFERILVDAAVAPDPKEVAWINPRIKPGEKRRVVTGIPGKTGIVYTLDAKTGEFLWSRPTIMQTVVSKIDGATGVVTVSPDAQFTKIGEEHLICPNSNGGKNWEAGAYSPLTKLMYMPMQNTCAVTSPVLDKPSLDSLYGIRNRARISGANATNVGEVWAISTETGKVAWKYTQRPAVMSLVSTGGGLVFGGDTNGRFRALDQKTGKKLWEINLGAIVSGYPISYAVDGKQYILASTGSSLSAGALNALTPEIKIGNNNAIFVFALE